MLTLDGIVYREGDFTLSADLGVPVGAKVAVIGPSGAGKSTLLGMIAGFLPPEKGRILWQGLDITALTPGQRPIAMLFQDNNLFPHLTAAQNIGLGIRADMRLGDDDHRAIDQALVRVGLEGLGGRKPGALSGGQQSRVALARVLVQRRPLILLDEPFAALGPAQRNDMLDLVVALASETGATLMMVSHEPRDAQRLGGQTILVIGGRAAPPVDTDVLLADPPEALRGYLGG
jgi:thiamine transport system ATP-binding protein